MDNTFHVFTDGSVIGNPGPGGWAAVLMSGDKRREMSGSSPWTTISEMGLLAAVEALRTTPVGSDVQPCSDSELLIHVMLFHVERWRSQGWRNSRSTLLQYQELWRELLAMNERMNIHWQWIRGHSRHPFQTRADALAYQAARTQRCGLQIAALHYSPALLSGRADSQSNFRGHSHDRGQHTVRDRPGTRFAA
jgi:ribonuclease HI